MFFLWFSPFFNYSIQLLASSFIYCWKFFLCSSPFNSNHLFRPPLTGSRCSFSESLLSITSSLLHSLQTSGILPYAFCQLLTPHTILYRSLVALSLILSLLLFKPAPLYILDEVDAALDLSHTQNIGQMLRTHFKKSQVQRV